MEHSEGNLILDNTFHSYYSFYSINSDNNNYSYNSITNKKIGAFIDFESDSNLLYHNSFTEYELGGFFICHACDNGTNNQWDNGSIGNYWDDYKGQDLDDNGIGDTPYSISGEAECVDHFPIWDDGPDNQHAIIYSFDILIFVFVIFILSGFSIIKKQNYRNK